MSSTDLDVIERKKQVTREQVWARLAQVPGMPPGIYGHIPDFTGAIEAAARLAELDVWQHARAIKANPDSAQLPVRVRALKDGKLLYVAVPRMATELPFIRLDPEALKLPAEQAAAKRGLTQSGHRVGVEEMRPIEMVICGSVAVNRSGARIGKGAGYSDLEVALLIEAGLVSDTTVIVTPVHHRQVIDEEIPETIHDFGVDIIVTPDELIRCPRRQRPNGVVWEHLTAAKIAAIPVLAAQARVRSDAAGKLR